MPKEFTVVTHEASKAGAKKRILIPNVCDAHRIPVINTFDMMRKLKVRLG
ncbi:DUF4411 family protein [Paenibacillus rhizoplanae]|uniref:DUF4411 family protein n=1 Tax=Paenibacillus rhizoplanae TaxID=1917181 RepID=A0ABW5F375_9BACL